MKPTSNHLLSRTEEGRWEPAKFSEMMLEFAAPLIELTPDGARDIDNLRSSLRIANLCWNAPVYAARGDLTFSRALDDVIATAPPEAQTCLRRMLADRQYRFADVPFAVLADVAGTTLRDARVTASAYMPGEKAPSTAPVKRSLETATPPPPGGMMPLELLFPDLAREEAGSIRLTATNGANPREYVLRERYCTEPRCNCRRVVIHVFDPRRQRVAASINYAFEPSVRPYEDEEQIALDPLNPQSEESVPLLAAFEQMIARAPLYRERLIAHYALWKSVVDDAGHALHPRVRSIHHDDPSFRPAFAREPVRRTATKVGANDACPCGSGRKYKKCCRQ